VVILTVLDQLPEPAGRGGGSGSEQAGRLVEELGAAIIDGGNELNLIIPPALDGSCRYSGGLPRVSV